MCAGAPANTTTYSFFEEAEDMYAGDIAIGMCNLGYDGDVYTSCETDASNWTAVRGSCTDYEIEIISDGEREGVIR